MTQKERILERLKTGQWLSTVEMTLDMHIFGGGQRIYDLRKEGHNIIERKVAGKTFSEYRLLPPQTPILPQAMKPKVETQPQLL